LFHKALVLPFGDGRVVLFFSGDGGGGCHINTTPFLPTTMVEAFATTTQHLSIFRQQWWKRLLHQHNTFSSSNGDCYNDASSFLLLVAMVEAIVVVSLL
jgi:hypothetical protein